MALIDPRTAEQLYYESKKKYSDAYNARYTSQKKESNYIAQKKEYGKRLYSYKEQKISIEKRLQDVERILSKLLGNGGWFDNNVPESISDASSALERLSESFTQGFKLVGGVATIASLGDLFATEPVEKNVNSSSALESYKKEKTRLEALLLDIKSKISNAEALLNELQRKINDCDLQQASYTKKINQFAYEMSYYKKYMR